MVKQLEGLKIRAMNDKMEKEIGEPVVTPRHLRVELERPELLNVLEVFGKEMDMPIDGSAELET